jgi:hypothetical protein
MLLVRWVRVLPNTVCRSLPLSPLSFCPPLLLRVRLRLASALLRAQDAH